MKTNLARALCAVALGLASLTAAGLLHSEVQPSAEQLSIALGGAHRHRAHPRTDRPVYRPGETVYLDAPVLHAASRMPMAAIRWAQVKIKSPRGDTVVSGQAMIHQGTLGYSWAIPHGQAGGEYTAVVDLAQDGPPAEVTFGVRSYRVARLRTDLQFLRKAYGPGDELNATLTATRSEGGIPAGARVTAVATVDGAEVHRATLALGAQGAVAVRFTLPKEISAGNGTLALVIEDGGVQETAARSIPIVLARIALSTYPEGGELVAGLPARVYVEARSFRGLPADVAGRVLDRAGAEVARFRTSHEGRGRFELTPAEGGAYAIAVDEPAGIADRFKLPPVQAAGVSLIALDDVAEAGKPVRLRVAASADARVTVVLARLEQEVARHSLELLARQPQDVSLEPVGGADGVLRATVLNGKGVPRAERLVFRRPERAFRVDVTVSPERTVPGAQVKVKVKCTDADGKPVSATVALNVVDDAVLETIERRERAPRLPVQVLLGSDVRELADAHVYLGTGPDAAASLDLLLGTQGWRRFAYRNVEAFVKQHGDAARRAIAQVSAPLPQRQEMIEEGGMLKGAVMPAMPGGTRAAMAPPPAARPMEPEAAADDLGAVAEVAPQGDPQAAQPAEAQDEAQAAPPLPPPVVDAAVGADADMAEEPPAPAAKPAGGRAAPMMDRMLSTVSRNCVYKSCP